MWAYTLLQLVVTDHAQYFKNTRKDGGELLSACFEGIEHVSEFKNCNITARIVGQYLLPHLRIVETLIHVHIETTKK